MQLINGVKIINLFNNRLVQIKWDATTTPNIDGIKIYKSAIPYGAFTEIATVDTNTTSYVDSPSRVPFYDWYYKIVEYMGSVLGPSPAYGETTINMTALTQDPFTDQSPYVYPDNEDFQYWIDEIKRRNLWMLEADGEPFKLLKRMWVGTSCPLCDVESGNQCPNPLGKPIGQNVCYGTGILQGYYQSIDIKIRVGLANTGLNLDNSGFRINSKPKFWTIWCPVIQTSDILVSQENKRFEVINTLTPVVRGIPTHREIEVELLPISDIRYKVPI